MTGDRRLQDALRDLSAALTATGARWMVIGGIALIARGVRRFTADIDAAIRGDEVMIDQLLPALAKKRIMPRIDDAAQFARENLVLLLRHEPSGVELDVSLAWTEFEHEAIAAATAANAFTSKLITSTIAHCDDNWAEAARRLGLQRGNLHRLADRLGVRSNESKSRSKQSS